MSGGARNFWIDCEIDGRKRNLCGGPRGKDGGFYLTIYQRDEGEARTALKVRGKVVGDQLVLDIESAIALNIWTQR